MEELTLRARDGEGDAGDPVNDPLANPFLMLAVTEYDDGNRPVDWTSEYKERKPSSVRWTPNEIHLTISNVGQVASDIIRVDYQLVYCTYAGHKADEGFTQSHAQDINGSSRSKFQYLSYVSAGGSLIYVVPYSTEQYEQPGWQMLRRIYFRARVTTLWAPYKEPATWDFKNDPAVVEATRDMANPFVIGANLRELTKFFDVEDDHPRGPEKVL